MKVVPLHFVSNIRHIVSIFQFQFHRGVGGVITLGTATKDDIGELMSLHEALRLRYSRTVLCSCLIVLREGEAAAAEGGGSKKDAPPQEPRPLPAGSSITHLFEYENWKTLEKYIETDVANYLQKLFGMLAELRAERLTQVKMVDGFIRVVFELTSPPDQVRPDSSILHIIHRMLDMYLVK